jgi:lipid II:glycine glycyltransferase (peptidoglycan interpeptide bridge formation enzyme)
MLHALETLGRSTGCATIRLDSFMSGPSGLVPERHGYREETRIEFVVDLTRDIDEVWRALGKDQRERIRKLERQGLAVETGDQRADLDALRLVRGETREKRVRRGQSYALTGDDAFYDRLHRHVVAPGIGRLYLARTGGAVVAALLFSVFNRRAYSMFSGSNEEGYRLGAQSLLFWRAVQRFRSEGLVELNRGGVPADSEREDHPLHGIYLFKRRLGGKPVLCRSGFKVIRPGRHALMRWTGRIRRAPAGAAGEE